MTPVLVSLISNELGRYLLNQFNAGTPVLEDDGRLMFAGDVPWTSYIGVPYKPITFNTWEIIMKKFSIIAFTAFAGFLSACYKDKGNYDYKEINEITISGLASSYSVIYNKDVLHIEPNIKMSETITDPSRLSYYWILVKGTTRLDTLGTSPVLDYPVDITPDTYVLTLRIVDNETGVAWKAGTNLSIGTLYRTGLMLMGTGENGFAEVDMISMVNDTQVVHGILSSSGLPACAGSADDCA